MVKRSLIRKQDDEEKLWMNRNERVQLEEGGLIREEFSGDMKTRAEPH